METSNQNSSDRGQRRYTNAALTAIAVLLGVNALNQSGLSPVSSAYAQQGEDGLVSAAEQRKVMISEIRQLSGRIERLESVISRGVNVKVLEMPAVRISDSAAEAPEARKSTRK